MNPEDIADDIRNLEVMMGSDLPETPDASCRKSVRADSSRAPLTWYAALREDIARELSEARRAERASYDAGAPLSKNWWSGYIAALARIERNIARTETAPHTDRGVPRP